MATRKLVTTLRERLLSLGIEQHDKIFASCWISEEKLLLGTKDGQASPPNLDRVLCLTNLGRLAATLGLDVKQEIGDQRRAT